MQRSAPPKRIFGKKKKPRLPLSVIAIALLIVLFLLIPTNTPTITIPSSLTPPQSPSSTDQSSPEPTSSPPPIPTGLHGGRIIFTCTRKEFNQICMVNRDGSGLLQLTDDAANHYYPAMSPKGNALVFASNQSRGTFDLYLLIFSSSTRQQLTDEIGNVFSPDFSPDGEKLLFINRTEEGQTGLWVMDWNGQNPYLAYGGPNYAGPNTLVGAAWSPNGRRIALSMTVNQPFEYEIFLLDLDKEDPPQRLSHGLLGIGGSLDWSPDGRFLLIAAGPPGDKDIFRLDADTGNIARLTTGGNNNSAAYSPDGEWIVFNSLRNNNQADLYLMRADGSDQRQLTSDPEPDWQPQWEP
jgi:TolB protein